MSLSQESTFSDGKERAEVLPDLKYAFWVHLGPVGAWSHICSCITRQGWAGDNFFRGVGTVLSMKQ